MSTPAYLIKARAARGQVSVLDGPRGCEESEESEISRQFSVGGRYQIKGPIVGVVHRTTPELEKWRTESGLPRAGFMTVEGELVLVADVRAAVRSGVIDVIGVAPARGGAA